MKRIMFFAFSLLLISSTLYAGTNNSSLWLTGHDYLSLSDTSKWRDLANKADVIGIFVDRLVTHDGLPVSQSQIDAFVDAIDSNGKEISVELAGVCDWHNEKVWQEASLDSFNQEKAKIQKLVNSGHPPDYLVFDGPIRRYCFDKTTKRQKHTFRQGINATIYSIQLWRSEFPGIKIYVCSNFPNWGWKAAPAYNNLGTVYQEMGYGDYMSILSDLVETGDNAHNGSITGFMLDNPYEYVTKEQNSNQRYLLQNINFWSRLKDFQRECESRGKYSAIMFNSTVMDENNENADDYEFWIRTIRYVIAYKALNPDAGMVHITNVESWGDYPTVMLPDNLVYSLSNTACHVWYYK